MNNNDMARPDGPGSHASRQAQGLVPAGFDPSRGSLEYIMRWPRPTTAPDLVPLWVGEFRDFNDWVNFATKRLSEAAGDKYGAMQSVCIDALGRRCTIGGHFMRARDEGTFPIRYFWEFVPAIAIEAGTATTGTGVVHESAGPEAIAKTPSHNRGQDNG